MTTTRTRRGDSRSAAARASAPKKSAARRATSAGAKTAPKKRASRTSTARAKSAPVPELIPSTAHHEAVPLGDGVYRLEFETGPAVGATPYLIVDADEAVLIDPGGLVTARVMMAAIEDVIPVSKVRYVVAHHQDPDVCSAINMIQAHVSADAKVVCHSRLGILMQHMGSGFDFLSIDKHGYELTFGSGRTLNFAHTPYLHSPGSLATYDSRSRTAFTSDLFASVKEGTGRYATSSDVDGIVDFHIGYMPSSEILKYGVDQIVGFGPVDRIAPQHGPMIQGSLVVEVFERLGRTTVGAFAEESFRSAQQARLESLKLQALVKNASLSLMLSDADGTITYMNPAAVQLFERVEHVLPWKAAEIVGKSIDDFHKNPHHQRSILADHRRTLPMTTSFGLADRTLELSAFGIYDDSDAFTGVGVVWNDVTATRKAEESVAQKVAHLDALPSPVMSINKEFQITYLSKGGLDILGMTEEQVKGKYCYDMFKTDHCRTDKCRSMQAMRDGTGYEAKNVAHLPSGRLPILYNATPEYNLEGEMVGAREYILNRTKEEEVEVAVQSNSASVKAVVSDVSEISQQLSESASSISDQAGNVAAASEELSTTMRVISEAAQSSQGDVSSIAGATSELNLSVAEIAEHAETARAVAERAVASVGNASDRVAELERAAREISLVTDQIMEIAEQTKLLALNATIEAARAGEAGKGFAVVASEVKDLAKQTNSATKDIRHKIEAIKASSEGTISEIGAMTGVITEVNSFVGVVASATEEQRAASQEISDRLGRVSDGIRDMANNVTQAAEVTQEVTTNVASVSSNTAQVDSTATALRSAVQSLDASAEGLELAVSRLTE